MPSTRSQNPEILDGPDWITRRPNSHGRSGSNLLRSRDGTSGRGTQSGDELSSPRAKSVYSQYYPDINMK